LKSRAPAVFDAYEKQSAMRKENKYLTVGMETSGGVKRGPRQREPVGRAGNAAEKVSQNDERQLQ
jgi:hypothetical protein